MINGHFYQAGTSEYVPALLACDGRQIQVYPKPDDAVDDAPGLAECLLQVGVDEVRVASPIPGVASELMFISGERFVPNDKAHRWSFANKGLAEKLERSKAVIAGAVIAVPIALYLMFFHLLPAVATASVAFVPDKVVQQMGAQAFVLIEKAMLEPSELDASLKTEIRADWQMALARLELDPAIYRLDFYRSQTLGANAFALPNGQVVMTDELATLLKDKPNAALAVLLHEIGHVQHKHSVKMVAQSVGAAIVIATLFGDLETTSEVLIGSGSVLIENAFSRDMEREADDYALNQLLTLGVSPSAFADAMRTLASAHDIQLKSMPESDSDEANAYLSTHPDIQGRIRYAEEFARSQQEDSPN